MMKWCSVTFAAVMFADCVAVWAAAAVLADVFVLAVAAAGTDITASVAVAACFAVRPVHGSAAELVHAAE